MGALFVRQGKPRHNISPLLRGGGQEASLRAGTLNVPGIVGFAAACNLARHHIAADTVQMTRLRDLFEKRILERITDATVNGDLTSRLPGTTSITIPGVQADTLIANAPNICISGGSACSEELCPRLTSSLPWDSLASKQNALCVLGLADTTIKQKLNLHAPAWQQQLNNSEMPFYGWVETQKGNHHDYQRILTRVGFDRNDPNTTKPHKLIAVLAVLVGIKQGKFKENRFF